MLFWMAFYGKYLCFPVSILTVNFKSKFRLRLYTCVAIVIWRNIDKENYTIREMFPTVFNHAVLYLPLEKHYKTIINYSIEIYNNRVRYWPQWNCATPWYWKKLTSSRWLIFLQCLLRYHMKCSHRDSTYPSMSPAATKTLGLKTQHTLKMLRKEEWRQLATVSYTKLQFSMISAIVTLF